MKPAVFIDRDDTILDTAQITRNDPIPGDLYTPSRAALIAGSADALVRLKHAGYTLIVFTSQGGIARGSGTLRNCEAVNDAMRSLIEAATCERNLLTAVYYCPFHPKGSVTPFNREHTWRKPAPGMVTAAAAEFGLDIARSWAIGDKPRDCEAAIAAGVDPSRAILVGSSGEKDARCPDLAAAARIVVG